MAKNRKIILTLGIPASGKSTWAKDFLMKNEGWVRVSRDDYRLMLANAQIMDYKGESLVTELVNSAIKNAINMKYNVIVDQTNVNRKFLEAMINFCRELADVEFKVFDISLEEAIERDKNREASVGANVIEKMYKNYKELIDSGYDLNTSLRKNDRIVNNIQFKKDHRSEAVIFDIDGTLAHNNGRRGYFDWNKVDRDSLDEKVRQTLLAYANSGYKILIVTGRDGVCKELTEEWLRSHKIPYDEIYTRPAGDYRKDTVVKKEIYDSMIKGNYNVLAVYDDRSVVVKMWRSLGLKCYQVIDGDY